MSANMPAAVGIIGTGWVGVSTAISLPQSGTAGTLLFNDIDDEAEGEASFWDIDPMQPPDDEVYQCSLDEFKKLAERTIHGSVLASIDYHVRVGYAGSAIESFASEHGADMIRATHGRTRLKRVLMGSIAEDVVRSSTCPVFSVRSEVSSGILISTFITEAVSERSSTVIQSDT